MMMIEMNNGQTVIDDEDFEKLLDFWPPDGAHHQFRICDCNFQVYCGYAKANRRVGRRKFNKQRSILLHRLIIGAKPGEITDHVDRDKLNNRRSNLRIVTVRENKLNSTKITGVSRFRGVCWAKNSGGRRNGGKWLASINNNQKHYYLGRFDDEIEAAKVYNEAAIRLHGDFAMLNTFEN